MSGYDDIDPSALGPNMWLIDEMYRRYREDPDAVDEKWREFFADFKPTLGDLDGGPAAATSAGPSEVTATASVARPYRSSTTRGWRGSSPSRPAPATGG